MRFPISSKRFLGKCSKSVLTEYISKKRRMEMKTMNYEYCNGFTHTIKKGDTLYEISRRHNVPLALLLRANPYVDVFNLQAGDTICIPSESSQIVPYPINPMPCPRDRDDAHSDDDRDDNARDDDRDEDERFDNRSRETESMQNMSQQQEAVSTISNTNQPQENTEQVSMDDIVWVKYVVKPGDTLEDILEQTEGNIEDFVNRNGLSSIYMLPGIAYYIPKRE